MKIIKNAKYAIISLGKAEKNQKRLQTVNK
jgi:hypothetical protein